MQGPELKEIAALSREEKGYADGLREVSDPTAAYLQGNLKAYGQILQDDQVKATLQQRTAAVISKEWFVEAGGESAAEAQAADFVRAELMSIDFDAACKKMLAGIFYGYAVCEILWAKKGAKIGLADLVVRRRDRFRLGDQGEIWLLKQGYDKVLMPAHKFWSFATGADDDETPHGIGLAHWLYWPCRFKREGINAWVDFLDNYASPTAVARYEPQQDGQRDDAEKLQKMLASLSRRKSIAHVKGIEIEILETKRSGKAEFGELHERMERAISKIVLSQTMTTDDGSSLAQGQVHESVRDEVVKADSDLLCSSFNRDVIAPLCAWNFPNVAPPKVWRRLESDPDLKQQAERDALIVGMGFVPTQEYIDETYGAGAFVPAQEADQAVRQDTAALAQPARPKAPETVAEQLSAVAAPLEDEMIAAVRDLVFDPQITNMTELSERLLSLYPSLNIDDLAEVMGEALALAELKGLVDEAGD